MWILGIQPPTESGYYLTVYFNHDEKAHMCKAFYFSTKNKRWEWNPRWTFTPKIDFWWNVRHDYYSPCQLQENVDRVPEGFQLISKQ